MSHSLIEIPRTEWTKLRELYKHQQLVSTGYNMLQNFISWLSQNPAENLKIYALDGDWQQDGTFILDIGDINYHKEGYLLAGVPDRLLPAVEQHFKYAGAADGVFKPDSTVWHHIPREQALKFTVDIPAGMSLARLDTSHAEQVNAIWPHRSPGSVVFVERMIRYNDSVGVFDQQGKLVAWCLRLPLGSLGLLQVMDTHKRQGLGSLAVSYMSKLLAEKNEEVLAPVVVTNVASRGMFAKLGFQIIDKVYWIMKPAIKSA